jgi:hypothetical protein
VASGCPDESGFLEFELVAGPGEPPHRARAKPFVLRAASSFSWDATSGARVGALSSPSHHGLGPRTHPGARAPGAVVVSAAASGASPRSTTSSARSWRRPLAEDPRGDFRRHRISGSSTACSASSRTSWKGCAGYRQHRPRPPHAARPLEDRLERPRRGRPEEEIGEAIEEADRLLATFGALRASRGSSRASAAGGFRRRRSDVSHRRRGGALPPLVEEKGSRLSLSTPRRS